MVKHCFTDQLSTEMPANDLEAEILFVCHNILRPIHNVREEDIEIDRSSPKNERAMQKSV